MPDAYQAYLQEELQYLEGKIARCRKRLSAITRSEDGPSWELTVLIPRLHNDLLLPLRSLITNAQALPIRPDRDEDHLSHALLLASHRLQDTLFKLSDVSSRSVQSPTLTPALRSLDSLTHEAAIFSSYLASTSVEASSLFGRQGYDLVVSVDSDRVVAAIASCVRLIVDLFPPADLSLAVYADESDDIVTARWVVSSDSPAPIPDDANRPSLPAYDQPFAGRVALETLFLESVSRSMDGSILVDEYGGIQLTVRLPVRRVVRLPSTPDCRPMKPGSELFALEPPPEYFTPLDVEYSLVSSGEGHTALSGASPSSALVLYHVPASSGVLSRNLSYARSSACPVILRAPSIGYEEFSSYRGSTQLVILEPSDPRVLSLYVSGLLSRHHARRRKRLTDIH